MKLDYKIWHLSIFSINYCNLINRSRQRETTYFKSACNWMVYKVLNSPLTWPVRNQICPINLNLTLKGFGPFSIGPLNLFWIYVDIIKFEISIQKQTGWVFSWNFIFRDDNLRIQISKITFRKSNPSLQS